MLPILTKQLNKSAILVLALVAGGLCSSVHATGIKKLSSKKPPAEFVAESSSSLNVISVSEYEFNTFVFPGPVVRIHFPAGSPVVEKPVFLAGKTQVMLQFSKPENKLPIQMVVELENQEVLSLRLAVAKVPGVVHNVNGARPKIVPKKTITTEASAATPNAADIELLKSFITQGQPPEGFDPTALPGATSFDKFSVVPLAAWSDGVKRLMVFSLVATPGQTAVVSPPQFYRNGINAVMLDGDVVDGTSSPHLFIVEELGDE